MELVLIVTFAGILGAAVRYMVPGRDRHGLGLLPSVGVIIGSLAWSLVVWLGAPPETFIPWLISLGLATAGTIGLAVWLPKKRDDDDSALFAELTETKKVATP
jgi:hypothetical protein